MRIPFPERVNLSHALIFATVLCTIQIMEGTNPFFSGCVFCFIMIAAVGFNIAGGLPYPSGAFIAFNAFFALILPSVTKVILREPADSNLRAPMRTIEVYLIGMVAMMAAAIVSRRFRPRKALIAGMLPSSSLKSAYIGCAVFSVLIGLYFVFFPGNQNESGTFNSFLVQANRFPMLTFVLGVIYTVHRTNGKRSISWPLMGMILYVSLGALLTFSKEQLLSPFFAWAVTIALLRYRITWVNIGLFVVGMYFVVTFMVPYAQYGRGFDTNLSRVQLSAYLLTHMDEVREADRENAAVLEDIRYYDRHLGILDRLNIIPGDDAIIEVADREGPYGYRPLIEGFENMIPHVLFPNKPIPYYGNTFAHEIGIISDDDYTTGISFSPSADAYREGRIQGIMLVEPLVLMLVFLVLDSVIGDVRQNPVGLLTTILVSRASLEGMLCNTPILIGQALFTNVLAAYICFYVLPMLGSIFNKTVLGANAPTVLTGLTPRPPALPSSHPVSL